MDHDDTEAGELVRLAPDTIKSLREEIAGAVSDGIADGFTRLKEQATESTGRFVLDGLVGLAKKALWVTIFMGVIYAVGGWALVSSTWKALLKS